MGTRWDSLQESTLKKILERTDTVESDVATYLLQALEELQSSGKFLATRWWRVAYSSSAGNSTLLWVDTALTTADLSNAWGSDGLIDIIGPRFDVNPLLVTVDSEGQARQQKIEWANTDESEVWDAYSAVAGISSTDAGKPKYVKYQSIQGLYESPESFGGVRLECFPPADLESGRTTAPAGIYEVLIPLHVRPVHPASDGDNKNWFVNNCRHFLELRAAAIGCFENRDRDEAMIFEARAKDERERLEKRERRKQLQSRTLRPALGTVGNAMKHRSAGRLWPGRL